MTIHVPFLFTIYLFVNFMLSIISMILIDNTDKYWKRQEEPPNMNFFKLIMIGTSLTISGKVAYLIGYIYGYITIRLLHRRKKDISNNKILRMTANILGIVIKYLLFLPILISNIIFEMI